MEQWYNLDNLEALFKQYLLAGNNKPVSIKNYLSDFRHFVGWLIFKFKVRSSKFEVEEKPFRIVNQITISLIEEYKSYLIENNIPTKTINRRLSTVRKFCSFCVSQGWMKENPARQISNVKKNPSNSDLTSMSQILESFKNDLLKENLNQPTVKSFLNDIEEFFATL